MNNIPQNPPPVPTSNPIPRIELKYGLVIGFSTVALGFILYLVGLQEIDTYYIGSYIAWGGIFIPIIGLYLALKEIQKHGPLTIKKGMKSVFFIALLSGVIIALYAYIYQAWINPELAEDQIKQLIQDFKAQGVDNQTLQDIVTAALALSTPIVQAISSFIGNLVGQLSIGLVLSAWLKRKNPKPAPPAQV